MPFVTRTKKACRGPGTAAAAQACSTSKQRRFILLPHRSMEWVIPRLALAFIVPQLTLGEQVPDENRELSRGGDYGDLLSATRFASGERPALLRDEAVKGAPNTRLRARVQAEIARELLRRGEPRYLSNRCHQFNRDRPVVLAKLHAAGFLRRSGRLMIRRSGCAGRWPGER